jgi:hypothetical protein
MTTPNSIEEYRVVHRVNEYGQNRGYYIQRNIDDNVWIDVDSYLRKESAIYNCNIYNSKKFIDTIIHP